MNHARDYDANPAVPFGELARTLLRWSPLILIAAIVTGAVVYVLTSEDSEPQATARVGNTDEVRWPRDDVTRDLVVGLFDDPEVIDDVGAALDDPAALLAISGDIPPNQAYVEITVSATDVQSALVAADTAAALAVRIENERFVVEDQERLAALEASLAEYDASIAALRSQIEEMAVVEGDSYQRFIDSNLAADRTAWQLAELELNTAESTLSQETWRRSDVVSEVEQLTVELDPDASPVVVSRAAQLDTDTEQSGALPAVLAGLTAAVVASLAAIALDRSLGRARNADRLAAMIGRPTFDLTARQGSSDFVVDAGLRDTTVAVLSSTTGAARAAMVLADGTETSQLVSLTQEADAGGDLRILRADVANRLGASGVMYADRIVDRPGDLALAASLASVGYLVVHRGTRLHDVRQTIRTIEARGLGVAGLVFGDPESGAVPRSGNGERIGRAVSQPHDQLI